MIYKILNEAGEVNNRIVADQEFVDKYYPGRYQIEELPASELETEEDMEGPSQIGSEAEPEFAPDSAE